MLTIEQGGLKSFEPYQRLSAMEKINLVDPHGRTEKEWRRIADGLAQVLIVFPQVEGRLPFISIAAKTWRLAEIVSTGRVYLQWRTHQRKSMDCELYVHGQPLNREYIDCAAVRLSAEMQTVAYNDTSVHGGYIKPENFARLEMCAISFGPSENRVIIDPTIHSSLVSGTLRYLRFEVSP